MSRICDLIGQETAADHASYSVAPEDLDLVVALFLELGFTTTLEINAEWGRGIFVADTKGTEFQFNGRSDANVVTHHPGDHPAINVIEPSVWVEQITAWLAEHNRRYRTVPTGNNILMFIEGIPWGIEIVRR